MSDQPSTPQSSAAWGRIGIAILVLVLGLAITFTVLTVTGRESELAAQQSEISKLEIDLKNLQKDSSLATNKEVETALGISMARVFDDQTRITDFLRTALTWDSGETYEDARQAVIDQFGLAETDSFLASFLPPAAYNQDASGKRYYYIDGVGMNSAFSGDASFGVLDVTATTYRYVVIADVSITLDGPESIDEDGEVEPTPTSTLKVLLYVSTNSDGELLELSGIAPSGTSRESH